MSIANHILLAFQVVLFVIQLIYVYRTFKINDNVDNP